MPNCFSLTRKTEPEKGPVNLQQIDDEMRVAFNQPPDAEHWYYCWYDCVGLPLACGKSFAWIKEQYDGDAEFLKVVQWLDDNFTVDAWATIGRR